jgi:hypothetical protein
MQFTVKQSLLAAAASLTLGLAPLVASAQDHFHHEFHEHEFARFAPHDREVWLGGHWHHEWHNGRFGWWWFAGGIWYFYDSPVYPYPTVVSDVIYAEPATAGAPPPGTSAPTYYWCDNPRGYYPYVQNCGMPWRPVPAAPPAGNAPPPGAAVAPAGTPPPPPPQ